MKTISPKDLYEMMQVRNDHILVDILSDDFYEQKHIPRAVNACVYETAFGEKISEITQDDKAKKIIIYGESDSTRESQEAYAKLVDLGYTDITILSGGRQVWEEVGYEVEGNNSPITLNEGQYVLDTQKSRIQWSGKNLFSKHYGDIKPQSGEVEIMKEKPTNGTVVLDMNSIGNFDVEETYKDMLITHLKSSDFFDVKNYPQASFVFRDLAILTDGTERNTTLIGDMTIKGVTHEVAFDVMVNILSSSSFAVQVDGHFDRTRWGVAYGSKKFFARLGKHFINDMVGLEMNLVFIK